MGRIALAPHDKWKRPGLPFGAACEDPSGGLP